MIIDEVTLVCLHNCSERFENSIKRNHPYPYPSSCYKSDPLNSAEFVLMRDGVEICRFPQLAEANEALARIAESTACMPVVGYVDVGGYNCAQSAMFPLGPAYKVIPVYIGEK